jgi:hypothetical protein
MPGNWEKTPPRKSYFGHRLVHDRAIKPFMVVGIQYQSEGAWHVAVSEHPKNNCRDYWVSGGSFYEMSISYMPNNTNLVFRGPLADLSPEEKEALMTAIAEWGSPNV